jgi:hypothetical protein
MTAKNNLTTQSSSSALLIKRMLISAAIGLVLVLSFVLAVKNPNPEWGQYWMIRPLIVTPLFSSLAGLGNHFLDSLRNQGGSKKIFATILTVILYLFVLWFATIAGLGGTLWD